MKKLIVMFAVFLLAMSMVLAEANGTGKTRDAGKPEEAGQSNETGQPEDAGQPEVTGQQVGAGEPQLISAQEKNMNWTPPGLSNALGNVQNENARQRIQQNLNNFQERYQERFQNMEGVELENVDEETGAVTLRAREEVRFLGFIKAKATKRFQIDAQGNINEKAPWYRFMYAE
jgi:hypothetical protein